MFPSRFMSCRALILALLFVIIIPRAALSQSDFENRYKQRSMSNFDLCFENTSMCTSQFVSEMSHCLERLEETQDERAFKSCICKMHLNNLPAWNTCSECLQGNYNDQTLGVWSKQCPVKYKVGNLGGGKLCKCSR